MIFFDTVPNVHGKLVGRTVSEVGSFVGLSLGTNEITYINFMSPLKQRKNKKARKARRGER